MINMPTLMDRQRFQIRRDGARLGLVCGEIENQFRNALEQAALSVVNALQEQGEREMKPPAEF